MKIQAFIAFAAATAGAVFWFATPAQACNAAQIRAECHSTHGAACCRASESKYGAFCAVHGAAKDQRIAALRACGAKFRANASNR